MNLQTKRALAPDLLLAKIRHALETMTHEVTVPDDIAIRARRAVERMMAVR